MSHIHSDSRRTRRSTTPLHGFADDGTQHADAVSDAELTLSAQKRPREAFLPTSVPPGRTQRAGGMRVVIPDHLSGYGTAGEALGQNGEAGDTLIGAPNLTSSVSYGSADHHDSGEESPLSPSENQHLPGTPLGKVVDTGQEHTGRWTKAEHDAFLVGLKIYGKEWKKVAAKVKTRTVVQTRTHAQKYFQKLQKVMKTTDTPADHSITVEMGTSSEAKKVKKTNKMHDHHLDANVDPDADEAAAHLMAQMSSTSPEMTSIAYDDGYGDNRAYGAPPAGYPRMDAYFPTPNSAPSYPPSAPMPPRVAMNIIAPPHDFASNRGKFPEPSPAACGKRKLAEIAAAQMLSGILHSAGGTSIGATPGATDNPDDRATPPPFEDSTGDGSLQRMGSGSEGTSVLQIVNPDHIDDEPGTKRKKTFQGMPSPSTPWDGQLKALVTDIKGKEGDAKEGIPGMPDMPDLSFDDKKSSVSDTVSAPLKDVTVRSDLHKAVCSGSTGAVADALACLGNNGTNTVNQADSGGFYPLHSAASLKNSKPAGSHGVTEITRLLVRAGAVVSKPDLKGNTALHWAARIGNDDTAQKLIMEGCPLGAQNQDGETALHWSLRAGTNSMKTAHSLLQNGARVDILSKQYKRPLDVAACGFEDDSPDGKDRRPSAKLEDIRQARANLLANSPQSRTLLLHHPECLDHVPKSESDWEAPGRVQSIMDRISSAGECDALSSKLHPYEITISSDFDRAPLDLLSRVHSAEYLQFVNELSKDLEKRRKQQLVEESEARNSGKSNESGGSSSKVVVPFTPMVQKQMRYIEVKEGSHSDTSFSAGSLKAARRAAGAVRHAVDRVMVGRNRNAFCVVRPPGHHAGVNGLLAGGESCGFCIFNSVAAGAMHALSKAKESHSPGCERVAIVDIDAHHGNGTEEIVQKCHDPSRLFFFSVHIFDHDKKKGIKPDYSFYPGTGDEDDVARNIINVPLAPLWREKEVLSAPTSSDVSKDSTAQPNASKLIQTRGRTRRAVSSDSSPSQASLSDSDGSSREATVAKKAKPEVSRPAHYMLGVGRMAYRRAIQQRLIPSLRAFNPDLILLSTGFDAAREDVGNAWHSLGGKQRAGLDLEPEDYAWTTRKIMEVADICCQGRVVSVLEGGYGRTPPPPAPSSEAAEGDSAAELDKSIFSDCALRHLQALADPFDYEMRQGSS